MTLETMTILRSSVTRSTGTVPSFLSCTLLRQCNAAACQRYKRESKPRRKISSRLTARC